MCPAWENIKGPAQPLMANRSRCSRALSCPSQVVPKLTMCQLSLVPSSTLLGLMSLPVNSPISVSAHARAADTTSPHQRSTLRPPVGARSNERIHRLRGNEALTHPRLPAPSLASRGPGSSQPAPKIPAHHHDDLPVQRQFRPRWPGVVDTTRPGRMICRREWAGTRNSRSGY